MEEPKALKPHAITVENRNKITLTGVTDVGSFDTDGLYIETEYGALTLRGGGFQVTRIDLELGEMTAVGELESLSYAALPKKGKRSFLKGL